MEKLYLRLPKLSLHSPYLHMHYKFKTHKYIHPINFKNTQNTIFILLSLNPILSYLFIYFFFQPRLVGGMK